MTEEKYPVGGTHSRLPADLGPRVAVAVPGAAVLVVLIVMGGWVLALALALLWLAAVAELVPLARAAARSRPGAAVLTAAGAAYVALCLVHALWLRDLPHGLWLLIDVLLATFLGDTAAQLAGTAFGRRRLAPRISPGKTVEGLAAGIAGGTLAVLVAGLFQPWLSTPDAVLLGLACSLAAPAGDLLESALKRRAGVKDSGRLFGAHGGALDRIDAAIAAVLVGYYVARALT